MKRFLISSIVFSILFLTACLSPSGGVSTPTATGAPSETSSPTPTKTPTPSPESLLPQQVQEKFNQAGVNLKDMQNAQYDKDGLHITLESGEVIVLTNDQLQKGIYNGQDNVLQYRDEANQNVIYAFDPESKTFLEASKYIQKDKTDPEKYIQVANWDELYALWAKEKMFLIPFDPENTYFPPSDKIYRDYSQSIIGKKFEGEFNLWFPFGVFPEGMDSPFRFANFITMQKDPSIGRPYDTFVISEQVFNPDDGSFSVIHFMRDNTEPIIIQIIQEKTVDSLFFLPSISYSKKDLAVEQYKTLNIYYRENDLIDSNYQVPRVKNLVYEWFDTRHVPEELENIPCIFDAKYKKIENY